MKINHFGRYIIMDHSGDIYWSCLSLENLGKIISTFNRHHAALTSAGSQPDQRSRLLGRCEKAVIGIIYREIHRRKQRKLIRLESPNFMQVWFRWFSISAIGSIIIQFWKIFSDSLSQPDLPHHGWKSEFITHNINWYTILQTPLRLHWPRECHPFCQASTCWISASRTSCALQKIDWINHFSKPVVFSYCNKSSWLSFSIDPNLIDDLCIFRGIWNDLSHFWCKRREFSICLVHVTVWLSTRDPPRPPASRKTNFEVRKMSLQQSGRSQSWSQWTICFACWQSFARNDPIFAIDLKFKDVCKENTGPWMSLETNASFHAAKISGERLLRPTVPCNWPCHTIWLWPQACYKPVAVLNRLFHPHRGALFGIPPFFCAQAADWQAMPRGLT